MKINIIGAGMSGLLAANMLRRHDVSIYEKQSDLPNNHHAVLRFRTPEVGNILGIPFKKVNMIKTYVPYKNPVADSISYSRKCTGRYLSDRSIIAGTVIEERYIAPSYLIKEMAEDVDIEYNTDYNFKDSKLPTISTIPMPILMDILGYDYAHNIGFMNIPGVVYSGTVQDCDAYVSVLFPGVEDYSRATITGDQLIVEFPNTLEMPFTVEISNALQIPIKYNMISLYYSLGLYNAVVYNEQIKRQSYFKIIEIDEAERKKFMRWATVKYNIYSLGRYSTWRPKLLLDDLVNDVRKIEGWICK